MAGQGSARVTLREIDLSQVRNPQSPPIGVPAAVVGTAKKGPAFVPRTFANMQQFNEVFGSMLEVGRESNSNLLGPLALNEWMNSAQAGTFLRVLGVGDGKAADSDGIVEESGFVVGDQLVQGQLSGPGKVANNPHAEITANNADKKVAAIAAARTHFLGCFMKDKDGSRFLCDAGVQKEDTKASIAKVFDMTNMQGEGANGNKAELFIPKELINSVVSTVTDRVSEDVTLTFEFVDAIPQADDTIDRDTIQIDCGSAASEAASYLLSVLLLENFDIPWVQNNYNFSSLSFIPKLVFKDAAVAAGTADGAVNSAITFNLPAGKEGNEAFIVQTAGTDGAVINGTTKNEKVYFTGAHVAAPVIRGVLMAPQGVKPALLPNSALAQFADDLDDGSGTDYVRVEVDDRTFGDTNRTHLVGYHVGEVSSSSQSFKLILNGFKNTELPAVIDCSFDPDSDSYISKVLNTDPTKIEECGHYLYAHWDIDKEVSIPANDGLTRSGDDFADGDYANMIGFLVAGAGGRANSSAGKPDYETFRSRFRTSRSPWIVSQFFGSSGDSSDRPLTALAGGAKKLFRLYSLDDGESGNTQFRLLVSNLRYVSDKEYGSFDLTLEKFDSDPISGEPLIVWKNLDLDVDSRNFIGRRVGDMHMYYDFDRDESKQRLRVEGSYKLKNNYVRVELSSELKQGLVPVEALPAGFQGHSHLFTSSAGNLTEVIDNNVIAHAAQVFANADEDGNSDTISSAQVLPMDYVSSISRFLGRTSSVEADDDLAWGVKLSYRERKEEDRKELIEQVFNSSVASWTKFYPAFGSNPAWIDTDDADSNQNSFFSLEKIKVPASSLSSDSLISWDGTVYQKVSKPLLSGERFVNVSKDAKGGNSKYMKFRCLFQGGFDGVNIFDKEKAELSGVASLREGKDETASQKFTGPTVMSYRRGVDVLSDKSATEFQLLVLPGQRSPMVTDYAISACEERFDALLLLDIEQKDAGNELIEDASDKPHVRNTITEFESRALDTSFAAAYFPDVLVRRPSDRAPLVVPPSVGMLGVMSRNDSIADPWFAPAGLSRGRLSAIDSQVRMNRDLLDDLYDADINPIYVPAGREGEVYAFGQKTLLQDTSALDRINVRRLLIDIRRKVKSIGEQLLFEPNRASTLARFSALVEPIMADVQQRRGVERYKVQIDTTTTTQNDVENNTIRGKIYLQPTKSVEFISLDFVVANNI